MRNSKNCESNSFHRILPSRVMEVGETMIHPVERPKYLISKTYKFKMACGNSLYVTISFREDNGQTPFEVFLTIGKVGSCNRALIEALGRSISYYLRAGGHPLELAKSLRNIRCPASTPNPNNPLSCPDAIVRAIEAETNLDERFWKEVE